MDTKKSLKNSKIVILIGIIGLIVGIVMQFLKMEYAHLVIAVTTVIAALAYINYKKMKSLKKSQIIKTICSNYFDSFVYMTHSRVDIQDVSYSDIKKIKLLTSKDFIDAAYKGINFNFTGVNGSFKDGDNLQGVVVKIKFDFELGGKLLVVPKKDRDKYKTYKKIETSGEFAEHYEVYTTGQADASRLLVEEVKETLVALDKVYKNGVFLSFIEGLIFIVVNMDKNFFISEKESYTKEEIEIFKNNVYELTDYIKPFRSVLYTKKEIEELDALEKLDFN